MQLRNWQQHAANPIFLVWFRSVLHGHMFYIISSTLNSKRELNANILTYIWEVGLKVIFILCLLFIFPSMSTYGISLKDSPRRLCLCTFFGSKEETVLNNQAQVATGSESQREQCSTGCVRCP